MLARVVPAARHVTCMLAIAMPARNCAIARGPVHNRAHTQARPDPSRDRGGGVVYPIDTTVDYVVESAARSVGAQPVYVVHLTCTAAVRC